MSTFALPGGTVATAIQSRLDEFNFGPQPCPERWRAFADLSERDQAQARQMWGLGCSVAEIAGKLRVFTNSLATAAFNQRWPRRGPDGEEAEPAEPPLARRIVDYIRAAAPRIPSDAEVMRKLDASATYVQLVRKRHGLLVSTLRREARPKGPTMIQATDAEWTTMLVRSAARVARSLVRFNPRLRGKVDDLETAALTLAEVHRGMDELEILRAMNRACHAASRDWLLERCTSLDAPHGPNGRRLLDFARECVAPAAV